MNKTNTPSEIQKLKYVNTKPEFAMAKLETKRRKP